MKVVQINTFSNKSTGQIMFNLHKACVEENIESYVIWGRGRKADNTHEYSIYDKTGIYFHGLYTRLTDACGFASKRATKKLLSILEEIQPDVVHLHNVHGYYLNIRMLFQYLKEKKIKVVWTFHDCWPFTGHCSYFEKVECEKWKTRCCNCLLKKEYPASLFVDRSKKNFKEKKELFTSLDINIVTVSKWLEGLVRQSFLKNQRIQTIYNGINQGIFHYSESDLRKKYQLSEKKIILGVASDWSSLKGLDDFFTLSEMLSEEYKIVLIGLNRKQLSQCPSKILGLQRTDNLEELVEWYSCADVYVNASKAETFGMTTIEALACGTPVIVYNATAMPELIDGKYGYVVKKGDLNKIKEILITPEIYQIKASVCEERANDFSDSVQNKQYVSLYKELMKKEI